MSMGRGQRGSTNGGWSGAVCCPGPEQPLECYPESLP